MSIQISLLKNTLPAILLATLGIGCGKIDKPAATSRPPTELLQADRNQIKSFDSTGPQKYDAENSGLYTLIFGGTAGADFSSYLDTRLRFYLSEDDKDTSFTPASVMSGGWTHDPSINERMKSASAKIGAANIGLGYWLGGLIAKTPVTMTYKGKKYPLDSSRVGIMFIGPGYEESTTRKGKPYKLPSAFRWSILAHEARHSDCTGGISQADLEVARAATTAQEFSETFPARSCGHLHVNCPAGHQYQNLPACDQESWGAYTVGAIFLRGILKNSDSMSTADWEYLTGSAIDFEGRVLVPSTGTPDMSSSGVRD